MEEFISRIEVLDFESMGRKVAQWAQDETSRPANIEEMKKQLDGIATIPECITELEFVQADLKTMLVRLPPAEMIAESERRFSGADPDQPYPMPSFYAGRMSHLQRVYSRIGDYTIAQCK